MWPAYRPRTKIEIQRTQRSAADLLTHYFEVHFDDVAAELAAADPPAPTAAAVEGVGRHETASSLLRQFIRVLMQMRREADDGIDALSIPSGMVGLSPSQAETLQARVAEVLDRLGVPTGAVVGVRVQEVEPARVNSWPDDRGRSVVGQPEPRRYLPEQPNGTDLESDMMEASDDEALSSNGEAATARSLPPPPRVGGSEAASATASVLSSLMVRCLNTLGADLCQMFVLDDDDNLTLRAEAPAEGGAVTGPRVLSLREGFAGRVAAASEPLRLSNRSELAAAEAPWLERGLARLAGVPVGNPGEPGFGILVAARLSRRQFADEELSELAGFGSEVAIAMATADLVARAEELAIVKERMKLAREIHDGLASDLSAVVALFKYHDGRRALDPTEADNILGQMRELVEQSLRNARDILATLRPRQQVPRHLADAARKYIEDFSQTYNITATTRMLGEDEALDEEERDTFYQVLKEAMTNVRKHAQARTVNITLDLRHRPYVLAVEDDGVGIDMQAASDKAGSFGLLGIRERAALLGGDVEISSASMGGTRLTFYGPPEAYPRG